MTTIRVPLTAEDQDIMRQGMRPSLRTAYRYADRKSAQSMHWHAIVALDFGLTPSERNDEAGARYVGITV